MSSSTIRDMQTAIRAAAGPDLIPDLVFHSMFGGMAAYAHGRTFALLTSVGLALKLPPEVKADLLTELGARPLQFDEGGVVFKQYAIVSGLQGTGIISASLKIPLCSTIRRRISLTVKR